MRRIYVFFSILLAAMSVSLATGAAALAEPEALPTESFTSSGGAGTFVSKNGLQVKCTSAEGTGSFINSSEGTVETLFLGCTGPLGVKCTSLSATITGSVLVRAGFRLLRWIGHRLRGSNFELLHFICGGVLTLIRGGVLGTVTTAKSNTGTVTLKQSKGVNEFTEYEAGGGTSSSILEASSGGGKFEQTGEEIQETITYSNGVEVEIMG